MDTAGINYQANEGVLSDGLAILFSPPSGPFVGINPSVKLGNSGSDVTHTISVFNRTGLDQDFAITLMPGSRWATTVPASTGLIADGASAAFDLTVMIPGLNDLPSLVDLAAIRLSGDGVSAVQNIITNTLPVRKLTSDAVLPSSNPSLSGDGSRVAFNSQADHTGGNPSSKNQIFVINTNGTGLTQLTSDAVLASTSPSLSGDGSRVAFINKNEKIVVMNADGTGGRLDFKDIPSPRNPGLSTNGGFLAHIGRDENNMFQIYFIEAARADSDKDGVPNSLEGSSADNAAAVLGLSLNTGGTVDITLPAGQRLAALASSPAVGGPFDVPFPFGTVSYHTTSVIGGSTTASLTFSSPLPNPLSLYKVDLDGVYTEMPTALWTKTGPNSLNVTLTDGGAFDLDGVENGIIIDPIAVGNSVANTAPIAPKLLSPENGATGIGTDASFTWEASTDANGDTLSYSFFICENDTFTGAGCGGEDVVAMLKTGAAYAAVLSGSTGALFLIGIIFTGRTTRNKSGLLIVSLLVTGLLFTAGCSSGGGGGGGKEAPSVITHQVSGLSSGTTYFWKVVVSDGTDSATSEVRSFTTQ